MESYKIIKFGIFDDFSHNFGHSNVTNVASLNIRELIVSTTTEILIIEKNTVKIRSPLKFSTFTIVPGTDLLIGVTIQKGDIEIYQLGEIFKSHRSNNAKSSKPAYLEKYSTNQSGILYVYYSPKSKAIITFGNGIKIFILQYKLSEDPNEKPTISITKRCSFGSSYSANSMGPPGFDKDTELILLPTDGGIYAYNLSGSKVCRCSKYQASTKTIYATYPTKPTKNLQLTHVRSANFEKMDLVVFSKELLTYDLNEGMNLWGNKCQLITHYDTIRSSVLSIFFIDSENAICLNSCHILFFLNIRTGKTFYYLNIEKNPSRIFLTFVKNEPILCVCFGSYLRALKLVIPWTLWNLNLEQTLSIRRYNKFMSAARILIDGENSFIKLFTPRDGSQLPFTKEKEGLRPVSYLYNRGIVENYSFNSEQQGYEAKIIKIPAEDEEKQTKDTLFVALQNGQILSFDTNTSINQEVAKMNCKIAFMAICRFHPFQNQSQKRNRNKASQFDNDGFQWGYAVASENGELFILDYSTMEEIAHFSVLDDTLTQLAFNFENNCIVMAFSEKSVLFDIEEGKIIDTVSIASNRATSIFADFVMYGYDTGHIRRVGIENRKFTIFNSENKVVSNEKSGTLMIKPHSCPITGFSFAQKIWISSGLDGDVILWNYDFKIIYKIHLPLPLRSCLIMNGRCDILVATATEIMKIRNRPLMKYLRSEDKLDSEVKEIDNFDKFLDVLCQSGDNGENDESDDDFDNEDYEYEEETFFNKYSKFKIEEHENDDFSGSPPPVGSSTSPVGGASTSSSNVNNAPSTSRPIASSKSNNTNNSVNKNQGQSQDDKASQNKTASDNSSQKSAKKGKENSKSADDQSDKAASSDSKNKADKNSTSSTSKNKDNADNKSTASSSGKNDTTSGKASAASKDKNKSGSTDKNNTTSGDKNKDSSSDKSKTNSTDKSKSSSTDKNKTSSTDKNNESSSDKSKAGSSEKSKTSSTDKSKTSSADKSKTGSSDKNKASSSDKSKTGSSSKNKDKSNTETADADDESSTEKSKTKGKSKDKSSTSKKENETAEDDDEDSNENEKKSTKSGTNAKHKKDTSKSSSKDQNKDDNEEETNSSKTNKQSKSDKTKSEENSDEKSSSSTSNANDESSKDSTNKKSKSNSKDNKVSKSNSQAENDTSSKENQINKSSSNLSDTSKSKTDSKDDSSSTSKSNSENKEISKSNSKINQSSSKTDTNDQSSEKVSKENSTNESSEKNENSESQSNENKNIENEEKIENNKNNEKNKDDQSSTIDQNDETNEKENINNNQSQNAERNELNEENKDNEVNENEENKENETNENEEDKQKEGITNNEIQNDESSELNNENQNDEINKDNLNNETDESMKNKDENESLNDNQTDAENNQENMNDQNANNDEINNKENENNELDQNENNKIDQNNEESNITNQDNEENNKLDQNEEANEADNKLDQNNENDELNKENEDAINNQQNENERNDQEDEEANKDGLQNETDENNPNLEADEANQNEQQEGEETNQNYENGEEDNPENIANNGYYEEDLDEAYNDEQEQQQQELLQEEEEQIEATENQNAKGQGKKKKKKNKKKDYLEEEDFYDNEPYTGEVIRMPPPNVVIDKDELFHLYRHGRREFKPLVDEVKREARIYNTWRHNLAYVQNLSNSITCYEEYRKQKQSKKGFTMLPKQPKHASSARAPRAQSSRSGKECFITANSKALSSDMNGSSDNENNDTSHHQPPLPQISNKLFYPASYVHNYNNNFDTQHAIATPRLFGKFASIDSMVEGVEASKSKRPASTALSTTPRQKVQLPPLLMSQPINSPQPSQTNEIRSPISSNTAPSPRRKVRQNDTIELMKTPEVARSEVESS